VSIQAYQYAYNGACPCGDTTLVLHSNQAPETFIPRTDAPFCGFCRQHEGVWISDAQGVLVFNPSVQETRVQQFASGTAAFHFCKQCETLCVATIDTPVSKAVVRVALLPDIAENAQPVTTRNLNHETPEVRENRRVQHWTPWCYTTQQIQ
jgi:hypothetical protein